jgi:hypothetical protein
VSPDPGASSSPQHPPERKPSLNLKAVSPPSLGSRGMDLKFSRRKLRHLKNPMGKIGQAIDLRLAFRCVS